MQKERYFVINSSILRIIAMLATLLDHVAVFFINNYILYYIFRAVGRLSFVIFAFFIVEGVKHTKNPLRYLGRLFILYLITQAIVSIPLLYNPDLIIHGNVFLTLLGGASILVYFHHKKYKHVYLLLPSIALITLTTLSLIFPTNTVLLSFTPQYMIYGYLLILLFYLANIFTRSSLRFIERKYSLPEASLNETMTAQKVNNAYSCILLFILTFFWYLLSRWTFRTGVEPYIQTYALLALPLLALYNGELGYRAKWWRVTYYLFYPVHLIILCIIYALIYLI